MMTSVHNSVSVQVCFCGEDDCSKRFCLQTSPADERAIDVGLLKRIPHSAA